MRSRGLFTVCEEARCPNLHECWGGGTATLMLLGGVCTRGCRFCAVSSGNPRGSLDPEEPRKAAEAVALMELSYVVLTSVDRDDLPDQGAGQFAAAVRAVRASSPGTLVETLIPDFRADRACLETLVAGGPDVVSHNLETVERLTPSVRDPRAGYRQSLDVLRLLKEIRPSLRTKSSLMLGLGETEGEVLGAMDDLRAVGVEFLTLGQYLRPTPKHLPVAEYVAPDRFEDYRRMGEGRGFRAVASGPLVRSSYRAGEYYIAADIRKGQSP